LSTSFPTPVDNRPFAIDSGNVTTVAPLANGLYQNPRPPFNTVRLGPPACFLRAARAKAVFTAGILLRPGGDLLPTSRAFLSAERELRWRSPMARRARQLVNRGCTSKLASAVADRRERSSTDAVARALLGLAARRVRRREESAAGAPVWVMGGNLNTGRVSPASAINAFHTFFNTYGQARLRLSWQERRRRRRI